MAAALAAEKGWRMGGRVQGGQRVLDLCPDCLPLFDVKMCEDSQKGHVCVSQAMYRITYEGKPHYSCGKHAWHMVRDFCRTNPGSTEEPSVLQIREAIHGGQVGGTNSRATE